MGNYRNGCPTDLRTPHRDYGNFPEIKILRPRWLSVPRRAAPAKLLLALVALPLFSATTYRIDTVAGSDSIGDNGPAGSATLTDAQGVCMDRAGNIYISDTGGNRIRRIDPSGTITTFAGTGIAGYSGDGGPAAQAQLQQPYGVAADALGNLYIADLGNNRVRRITPAGVISTFPDSTVVLNAPRNVTADTAGNVYIAEFGANRILRVDSSGAVVVFAGTGTPGFDAETAPATATRINAPAGMFVNAAGTLFFADSGNNRVRQISNGVLTTVLGGTSDSTKDPAQLYLPTAVIINAAGTMWVADSGNHRVRRLNPNLTISTVAGSGRDLAFDPNGNVLQVSGGYLKRLNSLNTLATIIGDVSFQFHGDGGPATNAGLNNPGGIALDSIGNLWIADLGNSRIRKVGLNGTISTVAGNSLSDGLLLPAALTLDANGALYIVDRGGSYVLRLLPNGQISRFAGTGQPGSLGDGGLAVAAQFSQPGGIAIDRSGNVIVADTANNRVRRIQPDGTIGAFAGTGVAGYAGNQTDAVSAQFLTPVGVCSAPAGDVFVVDTGNHMVRRVSSDGTISAVAGIGFEGYSGDGGPALLARLRAPRACAVDAIGNLYIADTGNNAIRIVSPGGTVSTIAGSAVAGFSGDGGDATGASLQSPTGIAVDKNGTVWFADSGNNRIRRLTPSTPQLGELTQAIGYYNAASQQTGALAPGSIISIFGSGFGPFNALQAALQSPGILATQLGDTQVFFDDRPAALFYVQESQINAQVPFGTGSRAAVKMEVRNKGSAVGSATVPIAAAAPALFTFNGGTGSAVAMNQTGSLNGAGSPASRTSIIVLFGTGGGATLPTGVDGRIPDSQPNNLVLPVSATIGGQPANVVWAGDAPGNAGVTQFNIAVPSGAEPGAQPVIVTIAGHSSQPGVIVYLE